MGMYNVKHTLRTGYEDTGLVLHRTNKNNNNKGYNMNNASIEEAVVPETTMTESKDMDMDSIQASDVLTLDELVDGYRRGEVSDDMLVNYYHVVVTDYRDSLANGNISMEDVDKMEKERGLIAEAYSSLNLSEAVKERINNIASDEEAYLRARYAEVNEEIEEEEMSYAQHTIQTDDSDIIPSILLLIGLVAVGYVATKYYMDNREIEIDLSAID